MKFKILLTALVLSLAMPVAAQITTVQRAHEVQMSTVRLPQSVSGTIAFKACSGCDFETKRVNGETQYLINDRALTLVKFREAIARLADNNEKYITVIHHLERDLITEVSITIR